MKILILVGFALTLISCASVSKKGPSPYSASWNGEAVTPADSKACPADQGYTKMKWKDLVTLAGQCVRAKNFFQVERVASHLARIEPESHWGSYFLALAAESRKDYPRAFWMIELGLKKAPQDGILLFERARLNWETDHKGLAVNDLKEAVKRNPSITEAHLLLGQIQFTEDDLSRAQSSFAQVLSKDPKRAEALLGMGEVAFRQKNYDEAYEYHKKAAQVNPRSALSFLRMAQIQEIHMKDLAGSLASYKDLQRRVSLNRVDGDIPVDLNDKIQNLTLMVKQQTAQKRESEKVSKREPSSKKVSK